MRFLILLLLLGGCLTGPRCDPPSEAVYAEFAGTFVHDSLVRDVTWHAVVSFPFLSDQNALVNTLFRGDTTQGVIGAEFAGFSVVLPAPLVPGDSFAVDWQLDNLIGFRHLDRPDVVRVGISDDRVSSHIPVTGSALVFKGSGPRVRLRAVSQEGFPVRYRIDGVIRFWRAELAGTCYST